MWPTSPEVEAYTNIPLTAGKTAYGVDVGVLLKRAQSLCETYCRRKFNSATVTEKHYSTEVIFPRRPPITDVKSLKVNGRLLVEGAHFYVDQSMIRLFPAKKRGIILEPLKPQAIELVYTGGYVAATLPHVLSEAVLELAVCRLMQIDEQYRAMKAAKNVKIGTLTVGFMEFGTLEQSILSRLAPYRI